MVDLLKRFLVVDTVLQACSDPMSIAADLEIQMPFLCNAHTVAVCVVVCVAACVAACVAVL